MKAPLHVSLESLERGPTTLSGALPGSVLELEGEKEIRNVGDLSYEITVAKAGSEVLATGTVEASMELECVRSGRFFSTIIRDSAFLRDFSTEEMGETLDLTDDVREAVLLQIPGFPVSPEASSDEFELPSLPDHLKDGDGESPWNELDNLSI
jgi:uncharacterized metal-binding protein YceD (DUF177 family)